MPTKKTATKKSTSKKDKMDLVLNQIVDKTNFVKNKFKKADPETRQKIIAGLAVTMAGITALSKIKKAKKNNRNN